jgi:hypothetical protein
MTKKKKSGGPKLKLNKKSVLKLENRELNEVQGGIIYRDGRTDDCAPPPPPPPPPVGNSSPIGALRFTSLGGCC